MTVIRKDLLVIFYFRRQEFVLREKRDREREREREGRFKTPSR